MSSATGGYIVPAVFPDADNTLARIIHGLICGVTGLDEKSVRKKWQRNPPPMPLNGVDWCAFSIVNVEAFSPYQVQVPAGDDTNCRMQQYETFDLDCTFYGDNCQQYATVFRDGLHLSQNREAMYLQGIAVSGGVTIVHVPELVNDQWQDRCDITVSMGREIDTTVDILHFSGGDISVVTDILAYRVTDNGDYRITDDGNYRVRE